MVLIGFLHHNKNPQNVEKAVYVAKAAKAQQVEMIYFGTEDVDLKEQTINGYILQKDEWVRVTSPFPQVIINAGSPHKFDDNIISALKQKIPFTIASASIKENIDFFVESFHLDKWMKVDDIIYDNGTYQNKIAMFKDAALKLNVNIKDCLIVEDSKSGIENAYQAGCRQIIVVNSANNKKEYEKMPGVIKVIDDFKELL